MDAPYKKAFVIDDDDFMRKEIVGKYLKEMEINVFSTDNVDEAIKMMLTEKYDVYVIDKNLRKLKGGIYLIKLLNSMDRKKVIMISSESDSLAIEYTGALGISAFLSKPFSRNVFKGTVEKTLSGDQTYVYVNVGHDAIDYLLRFPRLEKEGDIISEIVSFKEKTDRGCKYSCCISPQDGCKFMKCKTCSTYRATGDRKVRNFSKTELIYSVKTAIRYHLQDAPNVRVYGGGMGKSTYNPAFLDMMRELDIERPGFYSFKIATTGKVKPLRKFLRETEIRPTPKPDLHFSLNVAPNPLANNPDAKRNWLMPGTRNNSSYESFDMILKYANKHNIRVTVNIILLKDFNDSQPDMENLVAFIFGNDLSLRLMKKGLLIIQLADYNDCLNNEECFEPTEDVRKNEIFEFLKSKFNHFNNKGSVVKCFTSLGREKKLKAGCGQLAAYSKFEENFL